MKNGTSKTSKASKGKVKFRPQAQESFKVNPPACRRVLWIVLVSIACVGFNLRFVSPRGFFDSLTPPTPPSPPLSTSKVIGLRHVDRWIRIDNHWTETCRVLLFDVILGLSFRTVWRKNDKSCQIKKFVGRFEAFCT